MAAVTSSPLFDRVLTVGLTDVSTAASARVVCPWRGKIAKIYGVLNGAITVADAAVTFEINGTAVTGGGMTVAYDGSAAGDTFEATPTAAHYVNPGDVIEIITDGGSTDAAAFVATLVIRAP